MIVLELIREDADLKKYNHILYLEYRGKQDPKL